MAAGLWFDVTDFRASIFLIKLESASKIKASLLKCTIFEGILILKHFKLAYFNMQALISHPW